MGHTETVVSLCLSRDGQRVVSGSYDGTAREWDMENGETILGPIKTGHKRVFTVVYSPDMTMFATAGYDGPPPNSKYPGTYPVKIWDAKTGKLVANLKGHTDLVTCLVWTQTLISGSADRSIRTWNTTTRKQIAVLDSGHTSSISAIAISPNGRILASASYDHTVQLWNLDNSQPIRSPLHHADASAFRVSFLADGKLLATGCFDNNAYISDVTAILNRAGLEDLLDQPDKSVLAVDVTRRPVRQPIKVLNRVPRGFFDDSPNRAHLFVQPRIHPLSSPSRRSTFRSRFLFLFRPINPDAHDTPFRPRPFHWVRNRLSGKPSHRGVNIELLERPPAIVDVSLCQAKRRNASARERQRPIPTRRPTGTNATAGSSRHPNNTVMQQSSGAAQTQSSSQLRATISTSTAPPVVSNTTSKTNPHATIKHAGRWARFWLFICCTSPEYTDGHH
ncbi:WD40-repeat-containing domain protein [Suillus americanus]|nr:WD40-repeat-containing domain protein [Suillus americanus]